MINYGKETFQIIEHFILQLNRFWTLDHSDIMPHILHTENSTQIDIIIENFETNPSYSSSRFAFELLIVGNHSVNSTMRIDVKKTLDDEHTPGIFEVRYLHLYRNTR